MVRAELSYNPYTLSTVVKFNGKLPKINSLVEKFQEGSLQNWVRKIPQIFYDEMNGYDFELEFSGTKLDYEEVVKAFDLAGVSNSDVRIFHKNELDEREVKVDKINKLLSWLAANTNRNFDYTAFRKDNESLFEGSYSIIVFQGQISNITKVKIKNISVEYISNINEVTNTNLINTPVVFYIEKDNLDDFSKNLQIFLNRSDVMKEQMFFIMNQNLDTSKVYRIIQDLGVETPQIVTNINDDLIQKYMEIYPISEYIYTAIRIFREKTDKLTAYLDKKNQESVVANKEIHAQINAIEEKIRHLKIALDSFVNRDNMEIPSTWLKAESELLYELNIWRKRKTKITNDIDARSVANDFVLATQCFFDKFLENIAGEVRNTQMEIDKTYADWYRSADVDVNFRIFGCIMKQPEIPQIKPFVEELLAIKEEQYIQPKDDIFGKFFKISPEEPKDPVLERTYYYQSWREYVISIVTPKEKILIQDYFDALREYEEKVSATYINHLEELIALQIKEKEKTSSRLSEDEQILQNDNDWLQAFCDQLRVIERG